MTDKFRFKLIPESAVIAISLALLCWTILSGWIITVDTPGYLTHSVIRPPLYPLILDFFRVVFGKDYFLGVILFQTIMVLFASYFVSSIFRRNFSVPDWAFILLYFVFITPLLPAKSIYAGTYGPIGRPILSEALTYAAFLATFGFMVQSALKPQIRPLILFMCMSLVAVALRVQMLFLYPMVVFLFGYLVYRKFYSFKTALIMLMGFAFAVSAAGAAQRGYQAATHNGNAAIQNAASVAIIPVLFLSGREDLSAVKDAEDRKLLGYIFDQFEAEKLFIRYRAESDDITTTFFVKKLNYMATAVDEAYSRYYGRKVDTYEAQRSKDNNAFSMRILPVLLRLHFKDCVRFWAGRFLADLNFREGVFFSLLLILLLLRENMALLSVMSLTAAMSIGNRLLLTFSFGNDRHLFYTNTTEQAMIVLVLLYLSRSRTGEEF